MRAVSRSLVGDAYASSTAGVDTGRAGVFSAPGAPDSRQAGGALARVSTAERRRREGWQFGVGRRAARKALDCLARMNTERFGRKEEIASAMRRLTDWLRQRPAYSDG